MLSPLVIIKNIFISLHREKKFNIRSKGEGIVSKGDAEGIFPGCPVLCTRLPGIGALITHGPHHTRGLESIKSAVDHLVKVHSRPVHFTHMHHSDRIYMYTHNDTIYMYI